MVVRWLVMLVFVAACGAVLKPPEPNRRLDVRMTGEMFDSDRGYRFAVLPEPGTDVVRLDVRYPVGWADDPPGKEGLAHLVEHLLFEAEFTRGETRTSISAELGRIAIWWNAATGPDHTSYEVMAPARALDELLRLEVDRVALGCAGLTPAIFAREREVVLNELRQRQGASGAELQRQIYEAVYPPGHPYRRVDTVATVSKLELADVCAFLAGPYVHGPALVIASGKVDGAALKASAGKHFARLRKRLPDTRTPPTVPTPQPGTIRIKADVDEPMVLITWPLPDASTPGARLLDMVWPSIPGRIDAFGFTYGWGHSARASILGGAHAPVLAISVTLASASKLGDAVDATEKAVAYARRILGEDRESPEWVFTWGAEVESLLARWESLSQRNEMFGDFLQYEARGNFLVDRVKELAGFYPGNARELAEEWLSPARARYILIEPSGAPASAVPMFTYRGGAASHGTRVDGKLADQPLAVPASVPQLDTIRYELDNGLRVILWPHGQAPLVRGRLVVDSGSAHDPIGKEGTSYLVGADTVEADSLVFDGRALATRVDDVVRQLAWELRSPGYELDDDEKKFLRGRLQQRRARERMKYDTQLLSAAYGAQHPYARPSMSEDSLDHISRDSVMSWARGHLVGKNSTLVLAGQFDPELVKKHIAYNADQVTDGTDSPDRDVDPQTRRAYVPGITEKPAATVELAVHFVGGRGIDRYHPQRLVLDAVLDARLSALRTDQAVTYGFSSSYDPRQAGGLWTIGGEADAQRAREAAATLVTILHELRTDPESYRHAFVLARQKVLERLLANSNSSATAADRLVMLARFDLPDDFYDQLARAVAGLTLPAFHAFVTRELAGEGQVFGAFGNQGPVGTAIAEAKRVGEELERAK